MAILSVLLDCETEILNLKISGLSILLTPPGEVHPNLSYPGTLGPKGAPKLDLSIT